MVGRFQSRNFPTFTQPSCDPMKSQFRSIPLPTLKSLACLIASGQMLTHSALAGVSTDLVSINNVALAEGNSGTSILNSPSPDPATAQTFL